MANKDFVSKKIKEKIRGVKAKPGERMPPPFDFLIIKEYHFYDKAWDFYRKLLGTPPNGGKK